MIYDVKVRRGFREYLVYFFYIEMKKWRFRESVIFLKMFCE